MIVEIKEDIFKGHGRGRPKEEYQGNDHRDRGFKDTRVRGRHSGVTRYHNARQYEPVGSAFLHGDTQALQDETGPGSLRRRLSG